MKKIEENYCVVLIRKGSKKYACGICMSMTKDVTIYRENLSIVTAEKMMHYANSFLCNDSAVEYQISKQNEVEE